jgi:hypothetical protein
MDEGTGDGTTLVREEEPGRSARWGSWARPATFGAAGLLAGGFLIGSVSASAAETPAPSQSGGTGSTAPTDPGTTVPSQPPGGQPGQGRADCPEGAGPGAGGGTSGDSGTSGTGYST